MKTVWLQGVTDPDKKKDLESAIRGATVLKQVLLKILNDRAANIERKGFREEDYATAGWETLQAFRNGRLAELNEIADLFDFDSIG